MVKKLLLDVGMIGVSAALLLQLALVTVPKYQFAGCGFQTSGCGLLESAFPLGVFLVGVWRLVVDLRNLRSS